MDNSPLLNHNGIHTSQSSFAAPVLQRAAHKSRAAKCTESLDFHQIHNEIRLQGTEQIDWYTERSAIG